MAIVGYTNAGKSTLFNALSGSQVLVEDKLFATLDPTTRRLELPDKKRVLLTDTVGFIQKLPTSLVAAFRATLEELEEADLLLHIVDIKHSNALEQSQAVAEVLESLGIKDKPLLTVLNKIDLLAERADSEVVRARVASYTSQVAGVGWDVVAVSALAGWGLDKLLDSVARILSRLTEVPAATGQVRIIGS